MRHVREVMRMHREACVPMREIARLTGLARSTVRDMIVRFDRSGLAWPVRVARLQITSAICSASTSRKYGFTKIRHDCIHQWGTRA